MTRREPLPHSPDLHRPHDLNYPSFLAWARVVFACGECRRWRDEQERLWCIVHGTGGEAAR